MIYSMTGYGAASRQAILTGPDGVPSGRTATVTVEFRTVNSRFLDMLFRVPDECRPFEPAIRELLAKTLSRGKLECRINLQRVDLGGAAATLNDGTLAQLQALVQQVL